MKNYFFHRLNGFFLALWLVLGGARRRAWRECDVGGHAGG